MCKKIKVNLLMLQTSMLKGHIALWSFVHSFVRSLLLACGQEQLEIGSCNSIYRKRGSFFFFFFFFCLFVCFYSAGFVVPELCHLFDMCCKPMGRNKIL